MSAIRAACLLVLGISCVHRAFALGDCSTPFAVSSAATVSFTGVNQIGDPFSASSTGADITISNSTLSACTGVMSLTAAGAITEDAASSLTASTLTGNAQGNTSLVGANQVSELGTFMSGGTFDFANALPIGQTGALVLSGDSSFDAGANAITLTNAGNSFAGAISLTGSNVSLTNSVGTTLGASTVDGTLNVISNGAVLQTGALMVLGTASFDAGVNPITLTNVGNDLTGAVAATGSAISIADSNGLTSGTVNSTGALNLLATNTTNNGSLTFGNGATTGNVIGNYSQFGTLNLHATSSSSDQLAISGTASLGGTLSVAFSSQPIVGQSFTVLTASDVSGTFATVNVTGLAEAQVANLAYDATSVVLTINATTPVILQSFEVD